LLQQEEMRARRPEHQASLLKARCLVRRQALRQEVRPPQAELPLPRAVALAQLAHNRQQPRLCRAGNRQMEPLELLPEPGRAGPARSQDLLSGLKEQPSANTAPSPSESDWINSSSSPPGNPFGTQTPVLLFGSGSSWSV